MNYLYVCNAASDSISKINLLSFKEEYKVEMKPFESDKIGPNDICVYNNKLFVVNRYDNSLSIIDISSTGNVENYYIGSHCNSIDIFENKAYITCSDSNCVMVFDIISKKIVEEIKCGDLPTSVSVDKRNRKLLITNMQSDSIDIVDCDNKEEAKNIRVGPYPAKAVYTLDSEYIVVCESNIGGDSKGSILFISNKNYNVLYRVPVGITPVNLYCDEDKCYISNFGEGSISIVNIRNFEHIKKVNVGGMPEGIIKFGENIIVGDIYNNLLMAIDISKENKKAINIGGEPTGMAIY